jgi:hypothetical protein
MDKIDEIAFKKDLLIAIHEVCNKYLGEGEINEYEMSMKSFKDEILLPISVFEINKIKYVVGVKNE